MDNDYRIGIGFDAHAFADGRDLILGGLNVPYEAGLAGHSDADALLHAIGDAILGALGREDIGHHFPDSDDSLKDIPSSRIISAITAMMREDGYRVINVDAVIIAQEPMMARYIPEMKKNIGFLLDLPQDSVGLKATTTEMMGFTGRGEGLAAMATILLRNAQEQNG